MRSPSDAVLVQLDWMWSLSVKVSSTSVSFIFHSVPRLSTACSWRNEPTEVVPVCGEHVIEHVDRGPDAAVNEDRELAEPGDLGSPRLCYVVHRRNGGAFTFASRRGWFVSQRRFECILSRTA